MSNGNHTRREFLQLSIGCALASTIPVRARAKRAAGPRCVVVGFDGVDPRLVEKWISSGDLPNLAGLRKSGFLCPLASTSPPNSPVAWSTFATGEDPSAHGVFGFLKRDPASYLPGIAPYTITPPRFGPQGAREPRAVSNRSGEAFWNSLDERGVGISMLYVPYAYPPPVLSNGRVLAGLGTPDLRFTNSSFTLFTSDKDAAGGSRRVAGGRIVHLSPSGSKIETTLDGPRGPDKKYLSAPLILELRRPVGKMTISLQGHRETLAEGQRSKWFPVRFEARGLKLAGRVRFHLFSVRKELQLYASPIQFDPSEPALPFGSPKQWMVKAVDTHGGLPTVGWAHDTSAVNAEALPRDVFLNEVLDTMEGRAELLLRELANPDTHLTLSVFTGTDRAAHIFYRQLGQEDGGPLKRVYMAMDKIVGKVARTTKPGDKLVVLSDHGFHSFDRMLHVNTWLESREWFHRMKPGKNVKFLRGVDWGKTMAYSMGNGQVYINQLGRESRGSVTPGAPKKTIMESIRNRLLELKDPSTGARPVKAVYDVYDHAKRGVRDRAPDLQIAFAPGYRNSWETSLGGAPTGEPFADNPKHWCGDHAASDIHETPGFIASNMSLLHDDPGLRDLSNTLKKIYGAPLSGTGRPLLK